MMSTANEFLWRTQQVLHKKPQVVPGALLLLAGSLIVVNQRTNAPESVYDSSVNTFLAMILVQMMPVAVLEMKIMSCADPVGLFCQFATPVTLLHACFLGMRLVMSTEFDTPTLYCSAAGCMGALAVICMGYRQTLSNVMECYSVWSLIALGFIAALTTCAVDDYLHPPPPEVQAIPELRMGWMEFFAQVAQTANSYIELVAFVPAVWTVFREDKNSKSRYQIESGDTNRIATSFFLFLVGFYVTEDILSAYQAYEQSGLASVAHIAHFLLLLDFGCYVLAHIYNPEKLMGELRRWLPVDLSHEV